MATHNPYAPPQATYAPQGPGAAPGMVPGAEYVPLRWRTALAAISMFAMVFADLGMRGAQLLLGDQLTESVKTGTPDVASALIIGAAGMGVLLTAVCSWVFVPVWMHRASSNLRGLGRYGMRFTPAGCAGWFFVPFANLVLPAQAMGELWRASDPDADQGSWFASPGTAMIGVWWAAWLISGVVSWGTFFASSAPSTAASIGLVANLFRAIAALALVVVMRGISGRQGLAASRQSGIVGPR